MRPKITCKMCRREGTSVCGREKCALKRRPFPPGAHGPTSRARLTSYGHQLREKQKAKRIYGLMERQFRKYFDSATRKRGDTGEILVQLLERRLDNVVFRLGFARTRSQARQLVGHGHILVDGKKVDIPSYSLKSGQTIGVRVKSRETPYFKNLKENLEQQSRPGWLAYDPAAMEGKVLSLPEGEDLRLNFDVKLIVEFYSR